MASRKISADAKRVSLNTPNDLKSSATQKIAESINSIVADSVVLYLKTKNFHWHMSGPHFRDYHILLDEQADQIFAAIDPLAERVRKLGHRTLHSLAHILRLTSINENDKGFVSPLDMINELVEDNKNVAESMRKAHALCDDKNDVATASLLEIYIDETERRTWFLFETSRGADSSGH